MMTDPTPPPMDEQTVEFYENGELVETRTVAVPKPRAEVEAEQYRTALAAEFTAFKASLDALTALPNNSFTGAREVKDFARAARRMFRAAIRDLQSVDTTGGTA